MNPSLQDRVADAIGDLYDIDCEIGRGGMAVVYRAIDRRLKRAVAVKVLPPELAYDPAIRTRFTREAQTAAQLAHPHIVPIYDVGEREGIAYFVMGLVGGGNLGALLASEPRQPLDEVRRLVGEVADALAYAHLRGVIHRDIKPDNIMLDADTGRALVSDFGIAWAVEAGTRLTITGNAVGTPTYMSPEQATGERDIDARSDIYSLGVIAYQMLTGRVPFAAGNPMALLLKHVSEQARPVAELRPDAPRALREVVERAMQKAPEDRWPTAAAMRDALATSRAAAAPWRTENREPVRYDSPAAAAVPAAVAAPARLPAAPTGPSPSARASDGITLEPPHLASLDEAQRADLRLWNGRIHLYDRIKAARAYALLTLVTVIGGFASLAAVGDVPPAILAPLVSVYTSRRLWLRGRSLRSAGVRLRRLYFLPRARWVLPEAVPGVQSPQQGRVAAPSLVDMTAGAIAQRTAKDRAVIAKLVRKLPKADRELVPDVDGAAEALAERARAIAQALPRLDERIEPGLVGQLDARIAAVEAGFDSPEAKRRVALLREQRDAMLDLIAQRDRLAVQLTSAATALQNLRLDLTRYRAAREESSLHALTMATSHGSTIADDIERELETVEEMRGA